MCFFDWILKLVYIPVIRSRKPKEWHITNHSVVLHTVYFHGYTNLDVVKNVLLTITEMRILCFCCGEFSV